MLKIEQVLRDDNGRNVLNDYFDTITIKQNCIIVVKNGLWGAYNPKTFEKILDCEWDKIKFEENVILAYKNSKIKVFDYAGTAISEEQWDQIKLYPKGFVATKNKNQGFFRYDGTVIVDCIWKRIEIYSKVIFAYEGNGKRRIAFDYDANIIGQ